MYELLSYILYMPVCIYLTQCKFKNGTLIPLELVLHLSLKHTLK